MKLYEPFQFLTTDECDKIIKYGTAKKKLPGDTMNQNVNNKRKNRIIWYEDSSQWQNWISTFNSIEKRIDWIETPQISYYTPGESYGWHTDQSPSRRTHQRLWTLTCELQNADNAGFEIKGKHFKPLSKGEAIIFPSIDMHRATSPNNGERISFTIWAMAKNYHKMKKDLI
jgi:hypothetical protein